MPQTVTNESVDSDAARALTTYRNYLSALSGFVRTKYGSGQDEYQSLLVTQRALVGFGRITRARTVRMSKVRELLFNAWHTEVVLGLPNSLLDPGLIRFTNQWAPVQAYYAVYSLWRVWFLIEAVGVGSHTEILRSASTVVRQRRVFPAPWSYSCTGGHLLSDANHVGFPSQEIRDRNSLSTPRSDVADDDWVAKTLRTTRRFFLEQRVERWKRENRTRAGAPYRRIPPAARQRIRQQLYGTTLFDFLYRLRIRSNYRDVDDFVSGQLSNADAKRYLMSLVSFTRATMFLLESIIQEKMPAGAYDGFAREFLSVPERATHSDLSARRAVLLRSIP